MHQKPPDDPLPTLDNPHSGVDLQQLDNTNSGDGGHQGDPIPAHGGTMWNHVMIVCAGFAVMFTTCAFIFAFGVYQALYEEMAQEAHSPFVGQSTARIGLIGTLAIALMSMGGPLAMSWAKLWSPQAVIVAGGWVFGIAYILASFSQRLWHFALTQGVLLGIGTCMAYVPTLSVAPTWFDQRRGLAMGIIIAGSGVGGMVWPPALRAMITHLGFRNALRISGCISLTLVSAAGYILRWEPKFQKQLRVQNQSLSRRSGWIKVPLVNWRVAGSRRFIAQALGCFLQSAGYSTPLFFYAAYARTLGYSAATADNFITVSNASNFVSRILIGYGADKLGRLNALALTTLFSTIAVFAFWLPSMFQQSTVSPSSADALFIVFTILYGSFASAYISLFPASVIELFGVQHFTSVNGVLYLTRGMGALIGTPLTGMLIPQSTALVSSIVYERAGIVCGVLLFAATLACFWVRIEATLGEVGRWKA
ncbi:monocarboxylate transporter [Aspergillus fischeri NRRL 181]|uniref:Monocarboxylate transporter n=1 Tax=Neosartorya fischeri (strain ATCC 1020 / DSM 3700 / CBS 544.65 / FGSC A1164 / JCM 1740 / NRRL 181 / WB 181) TaxID=331117 RepID=A1DJ50_NEOFI|nr:monocarboxylate transporter [Aspergillus fischeri NRRL 181]EAW16739.1 monocarboxylate transporter [Aspergillus fischeri NRRL 181]